MQIQQLQSYASSRKKKTKWFWIIRHDWQRIGDVLGWYDYKKRKKDIRAPEGPSKPLDGFQIGHVSRGGAFHNYPNNLRISYRCCHPLGRRMNTVGFRVSLPDEKEH